MSSAPPAAAGAPAASCPHCGEVAHGRFCAACGKEVDAQTTSAGVMKDVLGVKAVPFRAMACTAWFALARPALLSMRWAQGDRRGLVSPTAMISTAAAVAAALGVVIGHLLGHVDTSGAPSQPIDVQAFAPFLQNRFPDAFAAAGMDRQAFTDKFKQVGGWFTALWPLLLILPGYLSLAPWKRVATHRALIIACVETVFLTMAAGAFLILRAAVPLLAADSFFSTLFGLGVMAHAAFHIRHALDADWIYAATRPLLATFYFTLLIYVWLLFVAWLTLAGWSVV